MLCQFGEPRGPESVPNVRTPVGSRNIGIHQSISSVNFGSHGGLRAPPMCAYLLSVVMRRNRRACKSTPIVATPSTTIPLTPQIFHCDISLHDADSKINQPWPTKSFAACAVRIVSLPIRLHDTTVPNKISIRPGKSFAPAAGLTAYSALNAFSMKSEDIVNSPPFPRTIPTPSSYQ